MAKFDYDRFEEQLEGLLGYGTIESVEAFGPGHYRINGKLDIWPRRKKYLYHPTAEHGEYKELVSFLSAWGS